MADMVQVHGSFGPSGGLADAQRTLAISLHSIR